MVLSIKNKEVEQLARDLARSRGMSVTEAIRQSLENEMARESAASDLFLKLMEISDQAARIPERDNPMTEGDILGYDELGIPTR